MAAVKATPYSPSAKMGLQMKRRFWEEDDKIFGGHLYSNLPLGNVLVSVLGLLRRQGRAAWLLRQRPDRRVSSTSRSRSAIEHVLTHASKVHPQSQRRVRNGLLHVVGEDAVQPGGVRRRRRWRQQRRSAGHARQTGRPDLPRLRGGQRKRRLAGRRRRGGVETGEAASRDGDDHAGDGVTSPDHDTVKELTCVEDYLIATLVAAGCSTPAAAQSVTRIQSEGSGIASASGWATCST